MTDTWSLGLPAPTGDVLCPRCHGPVEPAPDGARACPCGAREDGELATDAALLVEARKVVKERDEEVGRLRQKVTEAEGETRLAAAERDAALLACQAFDDEVVELRAEVERHVAIGRARLAGMDAANIHRRESTNPFPSGPERHAWRMGWFFSRFRMYAYISDLVRQDWQETLEARGQTIQRIQSAAHRWRMRAKRKTAEAHARLVDMRQLGAALVDAEKQEARHMAARDEARALVETLKRGILEASSIPEGTRINGLGSAVLAVQRWKEAPQ